MNKTEFLNILKSECRSNELNDKLAFIGEHIFTIEAPTKEDIVNVARIFIEVTKWIANDEPFNIRKGGERESLAVLFMNFNFFKKFTLASGDGDLFFKRCWNLQQSEVLSIGETLVTLQKIGNVADLMAAVFEFVETA